QPFIPDDYTQFWERGDSSSAKNYWRPDYWLYFPTERLAEFDQLSPTCRQDYLTDALSTLGRAVGGTSRPEGRLTAMQPEQGPPGTMLRLTGALLGERGRAWDVTVLSEGKLVSRLPYNCQYGTFAGAAIVPRDASSGVIHLEVRAQNEEGQSIVVART